VPAAEQQRPPIAGQTSRSTIITEWTSFLNISELSASLDKESTSIGFMEIRFPDIALIEDNVGRRPKQAKSVANLCDLR
jgi:hypothetical protein